MSIETMLLIAIFLVAPLVQHLVRAERLRQEQRRGQNQAEAQAEGWQPSADQLPMPELPPAPAVAENIQAKAIAVPARKLAKIIARPAAATIRRSARRGTLAIGLGDPLNIRRAVVLATVIGPCRAASPHGSPDGGGQ